MSFQTRIASAEALPEMDEITALREATTSVERELSIEDRGWIQMGGTYDVVETFERQNNIRLSRIYYTKDPLARQAIRLWTDYTFGRGITWKSSVPAVQNTLAAFWNNPRNRTVLSSRGQIKSSDKILTDGEIFFILFPSAKGDCTIRWVDPLEIKEFITDIDDMENVMYYRREWTNTQGANKELIYLSYDNLKGLPALDMFGQQATAEGPAIIYHLGLNSLTQRGNPLLLPVLPWIKQYRRFLAARVAIMLAMARFAWKIKADGDENMVSAIKNQFDDEIQNAGSTAVENMGANLVPIKTDTNAKGAYDDGRMIKLQIASGTGIPEQYFGDISIGNLATAKTVELPMQKMFASYQQLWYDAYMDINNLVLDKASITEKDRGIDLDFPPIAPPDAEAAAKALQTIVQTLPQMAQVQDVQMQALLILGINNAGEVLAKMPKEQVAEMARKLNNELNKIKGEMAEYDET